MVEAEQLKIPPKIKETKELKAAAYEYFLKMFKEQKYPEDFCLKMADLAVKLLDPLLEDETEKVKSLLEEAVKQ